jgi:hypothetical protein
MIKSHVKPKEGSGNSWDLIRTGAIYQLLMLTKFARIQQSALDYVY